MGASPSYFEATKNATDKLASLEAYKPLVIPGGKQFNISVTIQEVELEVYSKLLKEYEDVFAQSHKDLKGIPTHLVEHRIDLIEGAPPV